MTRRKEENFRSGFTVVELIVVMLLIGLLALGGVLMAGQLFSAGLNEDEGKLSTLVRYLRTQAALNGQPYRLVIDLDEHSYWGEVMSPADNECETFLLGEKGEEGEETARSYSFDQAGDVASKTVYDSRHGKKTVRTTQLPHVRFRGGITAAMGKVEDSGKIMIHFFPSGYVEHAYIYIGDEDEVHTLETLPLAGAVRIHGEELDERDFERSEKDEEF